jgi:hypothetical protein
MPAFPRTVRELEAQGYTFLDVRKCKAPNCNELVMFYRTPNDKEMPMNQHNRMDKDAQVLTHFATCPAARSFQRSQAGKKSERIRQDENAQVPIDWEKAGPQW